jgi:hypothetical protein
LIQVNDAAVPQGLVFASDQNKVVPSMDDQDSDETIGRWTARARAIAQVDQARYVKAVRNTFALLAASDQCLAESRELTRQVSINPFVPGGELPKPD